MSTSTHASPAEQAMSTKRALPILLAQQEGRCAGCGVPLVGAGWHDEGWEILLPAGQVCGCWECQQSPVPEVGPTWTIAAGYARAEVNHLVPRSAGGLDRLSNYEAVCGPCNLAHWAQWKAGAR